MTIRYGYKSVAGTEVFFREAGPQDAPVILMLHGFPSASHMFRDLIPLLSDRFRLVAPDLPGFGQTKAAPPVGQVAHFQTLTPTGWRLPMNMMSSLIAPGKTSSCEAFRRFRRNLRSCSFPSP